MRLTWKKKGDQWIAAHVESKSVYYIDESAFPLGGVHFSVQRVETSGHSRYLGGSGGGKKSDALRRAKELAEQDASWRGQIAVDVIRKVLSTPEPEMKTLAVKDDGTHTVKCGSVVVDM